MNPDDVSRPARRVRESRLGQAALQVHSAADRVYQALTRPDRPVGPELHKKPWLAGLLSLLVVGAGQLHNRQLFKSVFLFLIFYPVGLLLWFLAWVLHWTLGTGRVLTDLHYIYQIVWVGLWLFAVVDAYRIARLLRAGKLVVRYGFLKQGLFTAAGFIPVAGALAPGETVAPDEVDRSVGAVAVDLAKDKAIKWVLIRVVRYGLLAVAALLLVIGLAAGIDFLLTLGGLVLLGAILLFLV